MRRAQDYYALLHIVAAFAITLLFSPPSAFADVFAAADIDTLMLMPCRDYIAITLMLRLHYRAPYAYAAAAARYHDY